ncbi:MAG: hypothetical protein B6U76_00970 [Desulfurococcales archaeon ex4484_217_2]|nr:MAG: hypothetical protein B6U76_00970 [Desulfurococcales archaeon ex4484_217_2]
MASLVLYNTFYNYRCPECGGTVIYDGNGELVCSQCGLVIADRLFDYRSDRVRDSDDVVRYVIDHKGVSVFRHDWGLGTVDIILRHERSLVTELRVLSEALRKLDVPENIREHIFAIYRKLRLNHAYSKVKRQVMAAAAYAVLRNHGRTLREVMEAFGIKRKIRLKLLAEAQQHYRQAQAEEHRLKIVLKAASKLKIKNIAALAKIARNSGGTPSGTAAAAAYIIGKIENGTTEKQAAKAVGVTEVTVRNVLKKLLNQVTVEVLL